MDWTFDEEVRVIRYGTNQPIDYALFESSQSLTKSKEIHNKFDKVLGLAEAKAWDINLDGKGATNKNPSYQIINYLTLANKDWGILTNGHYWRLYSTRSKSGRSTYYEIDLIKILETNNLQRFKYFYNFFRVGAFKQQANLQDKCFLDFVFESN